MKYQVKRNLLDKLYDSRSNLFQFHFWFYYPMYQVLLWLQVHQSESVYSIRESGRISLFLFCLLFQILKAFNIISISFQHVFLFIMIQFHHLFLLLKSELKIVRESGNRNLFNIDSCLSEFSWFRSYMNCRKIWCTNLILVFRSLLKD